MNVIATTTCASSGHSLRWERLDWRTTHRTVRKLQARIVKATKEGRRGKVRALQWLLTHSLSGKALTYAIGSTTRNTVSPYRCHVSGKAICKES